MCLILWTYLWGTASPWVAGWHRIVYQMNSVWVQDFSVASQVQGSCDSLEDEDANMIMGWGQNGRGEGVVCHNCFQVAGVIAEKVRIVFHNHCYHCLNCYYHNNHCHQPPLLSGGRSFSLIRSLQTSCGAHPPFYSVITRDCFPWG